MGTTLVKEKAKELKDYTFNAQALQVDEYIKTLAADMTEDLKANFKMTNIQTNQAESNFKDKSIEKCCNDDFVAGYATSEHLVKLLQDACKFSYCCDFVDSPREIQREKNYRNAFKALLCFQKPVVC